MFVIYHSLNVNECIQVKFCENWAKTKIEAWFFFQEDTLWTEDASFDTFCLRADLCLTPPIEPAVLSILFRSYSDSGSAIPTILLLVLKPFRRTSYIQTQTRISNVHLRNEHFVQGKKLTQRKQNHIVNP